MWVLAENRIQSSIIIRNEASIKVKIEIACGKKLQVFSGYFRGQRGRPKRRRNFSRNTFSTNQLYDHKNNLSDQLENNRQNLITKTKCIWSSQYFQNKPPRSLLESHKLFKESNIKQTQQQLPENKKHKQRTNQHLLLPVLKFAASSLTDETKQKKKRERNNIQSMKHRSVTFNVNIMKPFYNKAP